MPPHRLLNPARQFRIDVVTTTAAIHQEFEAFERKAASQSRHGEAGGIERDFLFEKLAELRVLVSELGKQFQTHADLVEESTLPLPVGRQGLRPFHGA